MARFRVPGSGFRVPGSGFRVPGSGFRVPGSGISNTFFIVWVLLVLCVLCSRKDKKDKTDQKDKDLKPGTRNPELSIGKRDFLDLCGLNFSVGQEQRMVFVRQPAANLIGVKRTRDVAAFTAGQDLERVHA